QHFDKLRAAYREEWHTRLTCHGAGQQGLPGSRRADKQDATRNPSSQALELARCLQKLNHLNEIVFGLIHPGHISKGGAWPISQYDLGLALAKAKDVLLTLRCSTSKEEDD